MNQKRDLAELRRAIDRVASDLRTLNGIIRRVDTRQLEARVYVAAIRAILINKNVVTAAQFDAAVTQAQSQVNP